MIQSKKINIIVAFAVVFALVISIASVVIGNTQRINGNLKTEAEYATKIFGMDIISIEIIADEADWQNMLNSAASEQYIMADVIVNGTKFQNVGVRPKGNSSLTQVASSDSDRYSFRLQFDEYIKDQTCFGLESFVVNNMLGDNTYMKEYVSYELMKEIGVDAPYFGYADIKVNGESWGLYLAVELYNDSFEQRAFGDTSGMLYNVKSMDMGGNQLEHQDINVPAMPDGQNSRPQRQPFSSPDANPDFNVSPPSITDNSAPPVQMDIENNSIDRNSGVRGGRGSSGGSLEYTDDNTESYSAIFNNVVGKGTDSDFQRVVQALKALSEGKELETYFDIDQILRYLAAHTIVVNLDSYSSGMAQNYYIYERNGRLTILPWDYNLAWGGFQSGSASSVINFPIDTPLSGVEMSSRPLIEKLFANTEYLEKYHSYLQQLIDNYFVNGKFEEKMNTLDAMISDYVKNDATAFCTYEEYKTAVSTFITLGNLRAQSVQGQLEGIIPSTASEQNTNVDQLISAGDLKLSDLGSMMSGKGDNNSGNRNSTDNTGGMEQWRQNRNTPNQSYLGDPANQKKGTNNIILIGVLVLMLIAALIFVVRFKKSY
ncbi:CotH kinase family protein [Sedimentibacter sp.]|uniref:CotH kinase family protein n=1 Tax=Sedimentibacter sp. TaxID=1960295 RepID=UPI0028B08814|nr:CotH kinase family protein [Sedimentibacter sp.]